MDLERLSLDAKLYLRPIGLGSGMPLAGGCARFAAVELSARQGGAVSIVGTFAVADAANVAAGLPAELAARFDTLWTHLTTPRTPLLLPTGALDLATPQVMGILNVTPDSFSDGGRHDKPAKAVAAAQAMVAAGAALVDIGGESTRPRAPHVPLDVELARVGPVLDGLQGQGMPLSIDTRQSAVMARALAAGAGIVNDVSALAHDPQALALVAAAGCPVVLMHAQGTPQHMQDAPHYDDCLRDVFDWLEARIAAVVAGGVARDRIIVDPGIGFGKTIAHNLELLRGLGMLHGLGCPILLGVSRKKLIGVIDGDVEAQDRLGGSLTLALAGLDQGVQLLRVHDVPATVQAVRVWQALRASGGQG